MGAWGICIFENDISLDWIDDITDGDQVSPIIDALEAVSSASPGDYVDNTLGWPALCAAEVVAASYGYPSEDFPIWAHDWIRRLHVKFDSEIVQLAMKVVERVSTDSEVIASGLREDEEWQEVIIGLKNRLRSAGENAAPN